MKITDPELIKIIAAFEMPQIDYNIEGNAFTFDHDIVQELENYYVEFSIGGYGTYVRATYESGSEMILTDFECEVTNFETTERDKIELTDNQKKLFTQEIKHFAEV